VEDEVSTDDGIALGRLVGKRDCRFLIVDGNREGIRLTRLCNHQSSADALGNGSGISILGYSTADKAYAYREFNSCENSTIPRAPWYAIRGVGRTNRKWAT
jgi:hypothetical protein